MMKKLISLLLCLIMILTALAGCASKEEDAPEDPGAYVKMYLTSPVYNFDPAYAYANESALKIASLLFDNLFVLDDNGKVKKSLVDSYEISEDEEKNVYKMTLKLKATTWSDGTALSANDVVFAWKRILDSSESFDAAALLYDIKNAKAAKEGDATIDDVAIFAITNEEVEIQFEGKIDYDQFLLNLTSYALVPLREDVVKRTEDPTDWAKSPSVMVCSGPFRLKTVSHDPETAGITLERNLYYFRDFMEDPLDESVTPYRLMIDYTKTADEIMAAYEAGEIFYIGDIPLSVRSAWSDRATVSEYSLSTHSYMFNQNAVVRYYDEKAFATLDQTANIYDATLVEGTDGDKIFANKNVRKALSLSINRKAIADAIVFAEAATALVPTGVFDSSSKKDLFRKVGGSLIANIEGDVTAAKALLSDITPGNYMFTISVPAYDEVHIKIAEMVKDVWEKQLGFHVAIKKVELETSTELNISTGNAIGNIFDDIYMENYKSGNFEVISIDYTALSADALSMLAPFAKGYTGRASATTQSANTEWTIPTHITGYNSEAYNAKIAAAMAEKDIQKRATILHEAEKILIEDMAVMPIIFNKTAVLQSEELSKIDYTYYECPVFTKMKLKDYEDHIPDEEKKDN